MKTKKTFHVFLTGIFVLVTMVMNAQTSIYIYKSDKTTVEYAISTLDSISFTAPAGPQLPDHLATPVDITDDYLQNAYKTDTPDGSGDFKKGALVDVTNHGNTDRYWELAGWTASDDCLANGNLDFNGYWGYQGQGAIGIFQADGSAVPVENGKLYQTIQLNPGYYELKVNYIESQSAATAYVVANIGTTLPDLDKVETDATAFLSIPMYKNLSWSDPMLSIKFTITATSDVSLGFVGSAAGGRVMFSKVELWQE